MLFYRETWADHFTKKGIRVAFWSAVEETARQENAGKVEIEAESRHDLEPDNDDTDEDSDNSEELSDDDVGVEERKENVYEEQCEIKKESQDTDVKTEICASEVRNNLERNTECDVDDLDRVEKHRSDAIIGSQTEKIDRSETNDNTDGLDMETALDKVNVDKLDTETCTCDKTEDLGSERKSSEHGCSYSELKKPMGYKNTSLIHTGPELLELFKSIHLTKKVQEGLTTVGMVCICHIVFI